MIGSVIAVVLALAGAPPSQAPRGATAPAPASIKVALEATDPEAVVCKTEVLVGSHLTSRICATNRDWDERRRADREAFENITLRAYTLQPMR